MKIKDFLVPAKAKSSLRGRKANLAKHLGKKSLERVVRSGMESVKQLRRLQNVIFSENTHAVLIIFQGMDASGKDGAIDHVMSGVNPVGYNVTSFKAPSELELGHDYLWRHVKELPRRGRIGIFNRSHYEEVVVVRVHPELLDKQHLPQELKDKKIWKRRFKEIRNFEKFLTDNGVVVIKFFLNVSKGEQRRRFKERMAKASKMWKFCLKDIQERKFWAKYMQAWDEAISQTSTKAAPWYILPADNKPLARAIAANILVARLKSIAKDYPKPTKVSKREFCLAKKILGGAR